ncbi:MAG: polysaccharide lyase family 1 protein, partial [Pseudomonadota bacterium]
DVAEAEENENSKADGNSATIAAPNPITDTDYEALVNNAAGFGQGVSGGLGGELCRVTSLEDKGAGTLRNCARKGNRWVVFDVSGEISLEKAVRIANDTTIDGRGADITITNHGLSAARRENIIIHNLKIERINGDGVTVFEAKNIWINHVTVGPTTDGTIDITDQSQNVTVSWSHIKEQDKTMLIGNRNDKVEDAAMTVTLHHNWYDNTFERNPLVRFASVHMYNNVLSDWGEGEGGGGVKAVYGAQMLLENNVFQAGTNTEAVLNVVPGWLDVPGYINARGNSPLNGARVFSAEPDRVFEARDFYDYRLDNPTHEFMTTVKTYAGWQPASFFQSDVFAAEAGARTSGGD